MKRVVVLAFNFGPAGSIVNGPGICLYNFYNFIKDNTDIDIKIFTEMDVHPDFKTKDTFSMKRKNLLSSFIKSSDVVHHWSGSSKEYVKILNFSNFCKKIIFLGPNVIDTVNRDFEFKFISKVKFNKILVVSDRIKYRACDFYKIDPELISTFMVGPDLKLWSPSGKCNGKILWKGNSGHRVKDVGFGLEVARRLPQYEFDFIGYPNPYDYFGHIERARDYKLFFCTSLSETMGMALAEQWACGIPSVTHPKIYLHGKNYKTGIITDRSVQAYCEAICDIMDSSSLYDALSRGSREYCEEEFSHKHICDTYLSLIGDSIAC